jgi:hypothetical protein
VPRHDFSRQAERRPVIAWVWKPFPMHKMGEVETAGFVYPFRRADIEWVGR